MQAKSIKAANAVVGHEAGRKPQPRTVANGDEVKVGTMTGDASPIACSLLPAARILPLATCLLPLAFCNLAQ